MIHLCLIAAGCLNDRAYYFVCLYENGKLLLRMSTSASHVK